MIAYLSFSLTTQNQKDLFIEKEFFKEKEFERYISQCISNVPQSPGRKCTPNVILMKIHNTT